MTKDNLFTRHLLPAVMVIVAVASGPSSAQSESQSDLRRENQRLQTRVNDLETELAASRRQIEAFTTRITELERLLREALRSPTPAPAPPPVEEVTVDETVPHASPRALYMAMQRGYQEATETMAMGEPNSQERRAYQVQVRSWTQRVNRELRAPVAWHVRLLETDRSNRRYAAKLEAIDPVSHIALGDPFYVSVPRPQAVRLDEYAQRGVPMEVLRLRGTLNPQARFDERRSESSPFDNPPLVGPFAEFGFAVEVRSLLPAAEDEENEQHRRDEAAKKEAD